MESHLSTEPNPYEFTLGIFIEYDHLYGWNLIMYSSLAKLASSRYMYHIQKGFRSTERKPSSCT